MTGPRFLATGQTVEVTPGRQLAGGKRLEELERLAQLGGDHIWIAIVSHYITDPEKLDGVVLDHETILGPPMIGCWRCEEPFSLRLKSRRCPGQPA